MKRTVLIIIGFMFVAGCGKGESTNDKTANGAGNELAKTDQDTAASDKFDFSDTLISLTKRANELEADFRFGEAAEAWREIDSMVAKNFGPESWQAANARLAGIVASIESNFDEAQLEKLRQIQEYQREFLDSFKAGNFPVAKQITDASTALTTELFGKQSPMFGKQMLQSASLNQKTGDTEAAIRDYHLAIENLKSTFHARHPDIEASHQQLGLLYLDRKKFGPAISNFTASARLSSELWGEDSLQYAKGANQLGIAYQQAGQLTTAKKIFQASETIRRRKLGPDHVLVAHSNLNLGIVCMDLQDFVSAEKYLSLAVDGFATQEEVHEDLLLLAKTKLSTVHMMNGHPDLAEPLLGQVVDSAYAKLGSDHPEVAELQYRRGVALAKQGKYETAEPILNSALETQKVKLGPANLATIKTMRALALLLKQTRRTNESENLLIEIQRLSKSSTSNEFQR